MLRKDPMRWTSAMHFSWRSALSVLRERERIRKNSVLRWALNREPKRNSEKTSLGEKLLLQRMRTITSASANESVCAAWILRLAMLSCCIRRRCWKLKIVEGVFVTQPPLHIKVRPSAVYKSFMSFGRSDISKGGMTVSALLITGLRCCCCCWGHLLE